MADSNPPKRGFTFKSKSGQVANESLQAALEPVKQGDKQPSSKKPAVVIKPMFGAVAKPKKNVGLSLKKPAAPAVPAVPVAPAVPAAEEEGSELLALLEEQEREQSQEKGPEPLSTFTEEDFEAPVTEVPPDLKEMADLIMKEKEKDPYKTGVPDGSSQLADGKEVPPAYVPQTRRGFSEFIKLQYAPYILGDQMKVNKEDTFYKYQEFVRDYMRNASPYRGILVYHGLGSGKTCTAIAAAEALFASSKKNIIVMSPKSLKKNFIREVTKCGFRHFQLQNYWVRLPKAKDSTVLFFANNILGISASHLKKAQNIWIPDFRKPKEESNYDSLTPEERNEIRDQILSIIEYDPKTNPTGRIRFISYNGVSAKKLMIMACDPSYKKFFDDAVIVVDEIHNLVRTMHGTIEPYIIDIKEGVKGMRKIEPEPITPDRWDPAPQMRKNLEILLNETSEEKAARILRNERVELYMRGYMFYRLLCDARNSKIVGLSGTPLINHPEELGILANVLHGYFTIIEGVIPQSGKKAIDDARALAITHPFIDFVDVKQEAGGGGIRLIVSLLPEGTVKVTNDIGVTHIPSFVETDVYLTMYSAISALYEGEKVPAKEEVVGAARSGYEETDFPPFEDVQRGILELFSRNPAPSKKQVVDDLLRVYTQAYSSTAMIKSIQKLFKSAGLEFTGSPIARAEPLLPPVASDYTTNKRKYKGFHTHFIPNKMDLVNKGTLVTRLTGLVSYYKGSSLELMPRVERDEVVRVPMSVYVQKSYSEKRVEEITKEKKEVGEQSIDKAWKAVFDMKETKQSNNFKMSSRQACNFAFPPEVARPRPGNKKEELAEALAGSEKDELLTLGEDLPEEKGEVLELPEEEEEEEEEDETVAPSVPKKQKAAPAPAAPAPAAPAPPAKLSEQIEFGSTLENEYKPLSRSVKAPVVIGEAGKNVTYQSVDEYMNSYITRMKGIGKGRWKETLDELAAGLKKKTPISTLILSNPLNSLYDFMRTKYSSDPELSALLTSTEEKPLLEIEADGEPLWKDNLYGKLLMELRKELMELPELGQGGGGKPAAKSATKAAANPPVTTEETDASVECKVGRKPGEKMEVAVKRATDCFRDMNIAGKRLLLKGENGLETYSPKYAAMLERIGAAPGSSLVYSAFLNLEGIGLFRIAMTNNGYAPIDMVLAGGQISFSPETEKSLRLGPGKQPRFLTFSGAEDEQIRAVALSIFNAQFSDLPDSMSKILTESGFTDNKVGELCRVFCITSAGAEGLSLRNVRAVHIMEPYWNEVRVRQVKGRAIRIGSHLDLAPEDRNVSIYTYVSVFSDESQTNTGGERILETLVNRDAADIELAKEMGVLTEDRIKELSEKTRTKKLTTYVTTTDEQFYSISEKKRRIIEAIECILKSSAIDCEINYRKNKDSTFMCLPLKGKIGQYIYNPDLETDILNVPQFEGINIEKICTGLDISTARTKPKPVAPVGVAAAAPAIKDIFKALKGVTYRMRPVTDPTGTIERFDMYEADQNEPSKKIPEKLLGTAGVKDGKPAPPVKMIN